MSQPDLSVEEEFHLYSKALMNLLSPSVLEKLARETGFVQREGKLKALDFVALCTFLNERIAENSLSQLCSTLDANRHISLSTEGLNQRFSAEAVNFLKAVFTSLLHMKWTNTSGILTKHELDFYRIRILDSTSFDLPRTYADQLVGPNGSGVKIQLEYELKTGQFLHLTVQNGKDNDVSYSKSLIDTIRANDLILRDLGFFSTEDLLRIHYKDAYYITRLKPNITVYKRKEVVDLFKNGKRKEGSQFEKVNLEKIKDEMKPGEIREINHVYIGKAKKLKPRVIIYKLTDELAEKRLRSRELKAKKKGVNYSRQTRALTTLNIYITNIPYQCVPMEAIHEMYSLRWQIEILFKTWKSLFKINKVKSIKLERLQCHIYGKLISLLLSSSVSFQMRELLHRKQKLETSEFKSMSIVKEYLVSIHHSLFTGVKYLKEILKRIYKMIKKNGRKSHRYRKKTVFDILGVIYERNQHLAA